MKLNSHSILLFAFILTLTGGDRLSAQEIQPPFTWNGKGKTEIITEEGTRETQFTFELSLDEDGVFKGKTTNDEGSSAIKHLFYGQQKDHELPGLNSRKAVIVILLNEDGNEPLVAVLNGKMLSGRYFYGEVLIKRYGFGSSSDKGLGIGNNIATELVNDEFPGSLKAALNACAPLGYVTIKGSYSK